jgi:hypothetical protein
MYDLSKAKDDFPWTRVRDNSVEPWLEIGEGWFNDVLPGWGDVIHDGLVKIDALLKEHCATERIVIAQVKEKFGQLRFYYDVLGEGGHFAYEDEEPWLRELFDIVQEMESATGEVCCYCGTRDNLSWRHGWIHVSCDDCERRARGHMV